MLSDVAIFGEQDNPTPHVWKQTNFVIQTNAGMQFDTYQCENCGITGKRFDSEAIIYRDHMFKNHIYSDCDLAKAQLAAQQQVLLKRTMLGRDHVPRQSSPDDLKGA